MREKGKNLWPHREMSVFHLIQKSENWTLLSEEQKDNHVWGSILISALQRQEGAWNSCQKKLTQVQRNSFTGEKLGFTQR